eukprot:m.238622 g.238622  ORF g.238622 m.238622 type:complete len:189 (-) comp26236_c0_seq10:2338-2904(-)
MLSRARLVGVRALSSQGSALPASWRTGRRGHADLPQILVAGHREGFIGRRELRVDMHSRLLDAHIPPYSYVVTKPGVLVGSTNKVEKTSTLHGGLLSSIRRKLNGGNMFLDIVRVNGKAAGSAILAPHDGLATVMPLVSLCALVTEVAVTTSVCHSRIARVPAEAIRNSRRLLTRHSNSWFRGSIAWC